MPKTDIDTLQIRIQSNAAAAASALNKLSGSMEGLGKSLGGVNAAKLSGLASGLNILSVATNKFTTNVKPGDMRKVVSQINKLGELKSENINNASNAIGTLATSLRQLNGANVDVTGLSNLVQTISRFGYKTSTRAVQNIPQITKSIGKLVNAMRQLESVKFDSSGLASLASAISKLGGKNATNAIPNIRSLGIELNTLLNTLSRAPRINQSVVRMTEALARLASSGSRANSAFLNMRNSMDSFAKSTNKAQKNAKGLVSQLTQLYVKLQALRGGLRLLWKSIESASDYVETLNFFNAAFRQVAENADLSGWEEAGYKSAEAYANSFAERSKELTQKMTGFQIGNSGELVRTDMPSLGLDPNQVMNYQATFGQMASSMGVTSENALKLSNALTMIGADLASVRNMKFEDVWEDMASGMVGMSRTLDKYGVNIRNVNLQQELYNLGIDKSIAKINQQDKAVLRTIILLNSTRYAWGDLANTINQPANQIRLLQSNLSGLARTIGSLFIPIISKVLPYINGLVIALQRLFSWIGSLFGIKLSDYVGSTGGLSDSLSGLVGDGEELDGITDSAGDAADAVDDANNAVKKLKKSVLGFDELNQLVDNSDTSNVDAGGGDGGGGAADMDDISGLLDSALDAALADYQKAWDEAFKSMENRANGIADSIVAAFKQIAETAKPTTEAIKRLWDEGLSKVANFSADTLKDFWNNFLKPMGEWMLGDDAGLPRFFNITNDLLNKINWNKLNRSLKSFFTSLQKPAKFAWTGLMDFYNDFLEPVSVWTMSDAIPQLVDTLTYFNNKVKWSSLNKSLSNFWKALAPFAKSVGQGLIDFFKDLSKLGIKFLNSLPDFFDSLSDGIKKIEPETAENIGYALGIIATSLVAFKGMTYIESVLGSEGILAKGFSVLKSHPYLTIATGIAGIVVALDKFGYLNIDWDTIWGALQNIVDVALKFTEALIQGIVDFADKLLTAFGPVLSDAINGIATGLSGFFDILNSIPSSVISGLAEALLAFFAAWVTYKVVDVMTDMIAALPTIVKYYTDLGKIKFRDLKDGISSLFSNLAKHPYATIAAGIGAVATALFVHIKKVKDDLDAQAINTMWDTFSSGGTVAVSKLKDDFSALAGSITEKMDSINTKINSIEETHKNIEDTSDKIGLIQDAISMGAFTAKEKIPELKSLFDQLLSDTETIFDDMYDVIVEGLAGSFGDTLEAMGVSSPKLISLLGKIRQNANDMTRDMKKEFNDLNKKLEEGKISHEEYNQKLLELEKRYAELKLDTTAIDEAGKSFDKLKEKIDFSEWVDEGTFNTAAFDNFLTDIKTTYSDAETKITESTDNIEEILQDFVKIAESTGTELSQTDLTMLAQAITGTDADRESQLQILRDYFGSIAYTIQEQALEKIPEMADALGEEYDKLDPSERLLAGSKPEYIRKNLQEWSDNTLPEIESGLKDAYKQIGLDVEPFLVEKGQDLSNAYFDGAQKNGKTVYAEELNPYYKDVCDEIFKDLPGYAEGLGYNVGMYSMSGMSSGVESNKQTAANATTLAAGEVVSAAKTALGINSPSTVFYGMGYGTMDDMKLGIEAAKEAAAGATLDAAKAVIAAAQTALGVHSPSTVFYGIGSDTMQGYINGENSMQSTVSDTSSTLADTSLSGFSGIDRTMNSTGVEAIRSLSAGLGSMLSDLERQIATLSGKITGGFGGVGGDMKDVGSDSIKQLNRGMELEETSLSLQAAAMITIITAAVTGLSSTMESAGKSAGDSFAKGFSGVSIPTPHFRIYDWNYHNVGNGSIPTPLFEVQWYKTGGLFNTPSMIGVGEAGAEAVLPLENPRTMRAISDSILSNAPETGVDEETLTNAIARGFAMAMMGNQQPINVTVQAELRTENDEVLARAVTRGQQSLDSRYNPTPKFAY